jgi:hypothetical protein
MKKIVLSMLMLFVAPISTLAIQNLDDQALQSISAREGVEIYVEGKFGLTQSFSNVGWGDQDGKGAGTGPAWLIIESVDTNGSDLAVTFKDARITIDVATAGEHGVQLIPDGDAEIPAYRTYVKVGLPEHISIIGNMSSGFNIKMNSDYSVTGPDVVSMGTLRIDNLRMTMNNTPTAMYVYAH